MSKRDRGERVLGKKFERRSEYLEKGEMTPRERLNSQERASIDNTTRKEVRRFLDDTGLGDDWIPRGDIHRTATWAGDSRIDIVVMAESPHEPVSWLGIDNKVYVEVERDPDGKYAVTPKLENEQVALPDPYEEGATKLWGFVAPDAVVENSEQEAVRIAKAMFNRREDWLTKGFSNSL